MYVGGYLEHVQSSPSSAWVAQLRVRQVFRSCFSLSELVVNDVHSEVFVVVSLTLFLPICLEQFARDNGFLDPDHTTPCLSSPGVSSEARCSVKIGWLWIDSASFRSDVCRSSLAF